MSFTNCTASEKLRRFFLYVAHGSLQLGVVTVVLGVVGRGHLHGFQRVFVEEVVRVVAGDVARRLVARVTIQ